MKIYHAHGHVVRDVERIANSQEWNRESAFCEVFFEFNKAKDFLLKKFNALLRKICGGDVLKQGGKPITYCSQDLKEAYIADHINYELIISEIDSDKSELSRIDWYFRHDGAHLKRYFVYTDRTIEYRVGDELPKAGTKFKAGDIVTYCGTPTGYYEETVLMILETPSIPPDRHRPWENRYRLLHFDLPEYYYCDGYFRDDRLHENDIKPCKEKLFEELKKDGVLEFFLPLQALIRGGKLSKKLLDGLLGKKILFGINNNSWRNIPELMG